MAQLLRSQWTRFVAATTLGVLGFTAAVAVRPAQAASHNVTLTDTALRGAQSAAPAQPAPSGASTAAARQIFDRVCGRCHPGGEEDIGPRLRGRSDTEAQVRTTVRTGHGRMRAIPVTRLSDADLNTLIPYLRETLHSIR